MGQQVLKTVIALSGRVDNSFGKIGEALLGVGSQVDALSQKIIDFGKDGIEKYIDYDDVMREVQALGEYDGKTMRALDEYNKSIAQTSRYTMEQAAQAEVLMAQLGLNMEQTKTLMPTTMNLATAANIELADSLDYLYYTLNALGEPMDYANTLSDQMSKAAAISAADINTLGQSMQRLGSGAQFFAGGSTEILAILGGISKFGADMQGASAGTQLRNFMLTLLAPTQSKDKLIKSLRVTEEEWAEFEAYMEDAGIDIQDTADAMDELGLSVYDSTTGELKPAIQIIGELDAALSTLSEADRNAMLGNLFGKRTTTTAKNLMESLDTIVGYLDQIKNESTGYTEAMSGIIDGGLGGDVREFRAAWGALKTEIGEIAEPAVSWGIEGLTDAVNSISNMDDTALTALVSGAAALGASGPALKLAGGAFRLIGYALTPAGRWAIGLSAAAAAATALTTAVIQIREENFEGLFGDMELDTETLLTHVNGISEAFNAAYTDTKEFGDALDAAVESYTTASTTLSSDLLTNMITGATLTPEQIDSIQSLGDTMGRELLAGIQASFDESANYATTLFGGLDEAENSAEWANAMTLGRMVYDNVIGQAKQLGQEFGQTLDEAIQDGLITGEEYSVIMEKMQAYNEAMAFAMQAEQAGELAKQLHKAQSVSWDSAESFLGEITETKNAEIEKRDLEHAGQVGSWNEWYNMAIGEKWINPYTGEAYTEDQRDAFLGELNDRYNAEIQGLEDDYAEVVMTTFDALMSQSDHGDAWKYLIDLYANGDLKRDEAGNVTWDAVDWAETLPDGMVLGGEENPLAEQLYDLWLDEHGYSGVANKFTEILEPYMGSDFIAQIPQMLDDALTIYDYLYGDFHTQEHTEYNKQVAALEKSIELEEARLEKLRARAEEVDVEIAERTDRLENRTSRPWNYYLTGGEAVDTTALYGNGLQGGLLQEREELPIDIAEAEATIAELRKQLASLTPPEVQIDIAGEQTIPAIIEPEMQTDAAAMAAEGGAAEEALMSGYGNPLLAAAFDTVGVQAAAYSMGGGARQNLFDAWGNPTLKANVTYSGIRSPQILMDGYADGGRATQASIFGEAGPEWAIPEEHTDRTARLLDAARAGAGFTWPELIDRNGGLNAGGGFRGTLIYQPTIIASDAAGVEQKLIEDKERLDRWWDEKQMRDDMEVYT